jgi:hypothetical protein
MDIRYFTDILEIEKKLNEQRASTVVAIEIMEVNA